MNLLVAFSSGLALGVIYTSASFRPLGVALGEPSVISAAFFVCFLAMGFFSFSFTFTFDPVFRLCSFTG